MLPDRELPYPQGQNPGITGHKDGKEWKELLTEVRDTGLGPDPVWKYLIDSSNPWQKRRFYFEPQKKQKETKDHLPDLLSLMCPFVTFVVQKLLFRCGYK
jgi:hypothetical protein